MKSASTFVAATLAGALCLGATTNVPAADWAALTMKPRMAASLNAGGKHVVSYFVSADGVCKLTVMIADTVGDNFERWPRSCNCRSTPDGPRVSPRATATPCASCASDAPRQ